jgi:hypothetical protein
MIVTQEQEDQFRQTLIDLNYQLALKCLDFLIEQRHNDKSRRIHYDGEFHVVKNYYHELSVADFTMMFCLVEGIQNFEQYIIVALMHDMLEDKDVAAILRELIGEDNFNLVSALSKNSDQYGGFEKISRHKVTLLVKTCDRMVNCTNALGIFSKNRLARYVLETAEMLQAFKATSLYHDVTSIRSAVIVLSSVYSMTERFLEGMENV